MFDKKSKPLTNPSPKTTIVQKTNRVLHIIFIAFLLITFRVWHLGFIQKEAMMKEAEKPKTRTILLKADRGEIQDRFHKPLTTNRICYNASIYYDALSQIPARGWSSDKEGNKTRSYPRKEYVQKLSQKLAEELKLDPQRIEDLIYSKASLFPHVPFVLKTHLSEKEYYHLKMLEKDWAGLHAEITSERYYPKGKTACHLIGHLGSIPSKKYRAVSQEIASLKKLIQDYELEGPTEELLTQYDSIDSALMRLEALKCKAYTLNDQIGKTGIEAQFEEELRGSWGIKKVEVDHKGKILRELPGSKEPIPGNTIVLSISSELQQFAEELLIQSEQDREGRSSRIDPADKMRKIQKQPWIKGGAIIAMDPTSGEILAFASCPRFDPNDFTLQNQEKNITRWLESETMISSLWDGHESLFREKLLPQTKKIKEEDCAVSWDFYLKQIIPRDGPIFHFFEKIDDIKGAVQIQEDFLALLYFAKQKDPFLIAEALTNKNGLFDTLKHNEDASLHMRRLESQIQSIPLAKDKLFAIDLCRLAVYSPRFGDELLSKIGLMKINTYRMMNQAFCRLEKKKKEDAFQTFHHNEFTKWREENQKEFLLQKRAEEKQAKTYARPYLDYLDKQEKELFSLFWEEHRIAILLQCILNAPTNPDQELLHKYFIALPPTLQEELIKTFRSFRDLDQPLFAESKTLKTEKDLASLFYPKGGFGYSRSYAFQSNVPQGSVFKLVTAYEALKQDHHLTIIEEPKQIIQGSKTQQILAYSLNQTPYFRRYKGGRLPKSASSRIGKIDIVGALEHSSNPFFSILAGDYFKSPEDLNEAAALFGFGQKSGIELPGEVSGFLPKDLRTNRTGLYSYAIGQHTLLTTPLQSALMVSAIANGGNLLKPSLVKEKIQHINQNTIKRHKTSPHPLRKIDLSPSIRNTILEGMDKSVWSGRGSIRPKLIRGFLANPLLLHDFLQLEHQIIGKTGTAEIMFKPYSYPSASAEMYTHTWFAAISFPEVPSLQTKIQFDHPELVVVVFLRFGDAGKEAAPLAAQMIRKWREIQKKL